MKVSIAIDHPRHARDFNQRAKAIGDQTAIKACLSALPKSKDTWLERTSVAVL